MTNPDTGSDTRPVDENDAPATYATPVEPNIQATHYVVSCLPEGHDDRLTYSVQVEYRGKDWWAVKQRGKSLGRDGVWSWGWRWEGDSDEPVTEAEVIEHDRQGAAWLAEHRFDFQTAMTLAKDVAPRLTYRGLSVGAVLATLETSTVTGSAV